MEQCWTDLENIRHLIRQDYKEGNSRQSTSQPAIKSMTAGVIKKKQKIMKIKRKLAVLLIDVSEFMSCSHTW